MDDEHDGSFRRGPRSPTRNRHAPRINVRPLDHPPTIPRLMGFYNTENKSKAELSVPWATPPHGLSRVSCVISVPRSNGRIDEFRAQNGPVLFGGRLKSELGDETLAVPDNLGGHLVEEPRATV